MSDQAQALAERFERAHKAFVATVLNLSDAQWQTYCPEEERTVAALTWHVASAYGVETAALRAMAIGQPVEVWARDALDRSNAEDGATYADCDRAETVELLRGNGAAAASFVRSLSDEQLARRGRYLEDLPDWTVAEWIGRVLVGHPEIHLRSIRAALDL